MDNFELHQEATRLADSHSPYMLAKMLLIEQKERIELAAHVERLTNQMEGALRIKDLWLPFHCEPEHEGECQALGAMHTEFTNALAASPATSLARRDLIKQAEALEEAINHMGDEWDVYHLRTQAKQLRQQAKEKN